MKRLADIHFHMVAMEEIGNEIVCKKLWHNKTR